MGTRTCAFSVRLCFFVLWVVKKICRLRALFRSSCCRFDRPGEGIDQSRLDLWLRRA
jgi:hypothetical protein